jgi:hypothetical protein
MKQMQARTHCYRGPSRSKILRGGLPALKNQAPFIRLYTPSIAETVSATHQAWFSGRSADKNMGPNALQERGYNCQNTNSPGHSDAFRSWPAYAG